MGAETARTGRQPRLVSLFCGGVLATGVVLWSFTSRLELPLPTAPRAVDQWEWPPKQSTASGEAADCRCLLQIQCPRYNFDYPQLQTGSPCTIQEFRHRSAKTCLEWRLGNFGHSSHVVLVGDLRLLYLYRYMRDELLSETERVEGPAYCKSVHKNWTHSYLKEERDPAQLEPPKPCHHLAINKLAKLEYFWADDNSWNTILEPLVRRCQLGFCPSVVVVSSRLDLVLRAYDKRRELSLPEVDHIVNKTLPLLERLQSYGVHVWWKPHENMLDIYSPVDIVEINEIIQQHNLRLMMALLNTKIPVWMSTGAIGWGHHQHCLSDTNRTASADFRCTEPYYLGNWAQKQYMDIIFNFLCGRASNMAQNPCCAGWS
ncbi:hypothetical protein FJT64_003534 [Amphibalanus amphitrite]|uniref:Uncharacterized protein n=1 Tax=Amphibalanus amphitrite TaxID=1232801 RepID=A0A6A4WBA9_AMPAM|nr:hypothetical protein FJT64_003534 [Amphibalanus amphitrite]